MKIPHNQLKSETLRAIIEEYVTRDGTDYGEVEAPLEEKIQQVMEQLESGKASISYDEQTRTWNIVTEK